MAFPIAIRLSAAVCAALALAACEEGALTGLSSEPEMAAAEPAAATEFIERDAEAPDVFSTEDSGLWDGRPSIGGIWIAHPDVTTPERVIIRNAGNGQEVVGALFRREREMPGPRIQVSSEAAEALGMLAGQPSDLSVVALRRERIPVLPPEPEPEPQPAADPEADAASQSDIEATPLDPAETAAAAVAAVAATRPSTRPEPRPEAPPAPAPEPQAAATPAPATASNTPLPPPSGSPEQPYIQIGIFSVEENARNAGESLRLAGVIPTIRQSTSGDKTYWRVLVGPVTSVNERGTILAKVRELGYSDAYAVAN